MLGGDLVAGQLGQETGWPLLTVVTARGRHHQGAAGTGHRDVKEPPFLGQQLGRERGGRRVGPGRPGYPVREIHQLVHAQQRRPQPQVRPDAFLDTGHHHHVPLQALGPVGGQQPDSLPRR